MFASGLTDLPRELLIPAEERLRNFQEPTLSLKQCHDDTQVTPIVPRSFINRFLRMS